jgi:hypothetical protein
VRKSRFILVLLILWSALSQSQDRSSNLAACEYGYATCDSSRLTPDEQAQVAQAAHARNFSACRYGYATCDSPRLTSEEQAQVGANRTVTPGAEPQVPSRTVTPGAQSQAPSTGVAENGTYYGELNANGVPKTVHVNGYYRKDGTYVRGHYRSAPGTNPPRSHGHR